MKYLASILIFFTTMISFAQDQAGIFDTIMKTSYSYGYVLHVPDSTDVKKPLIIFLHGSGERGNDTSLLYVHGPLKYLKTNNLNAYVLAPQCPAGEDWESESLHALIKEICSENQIDTNRIYLTGLSMGAWGSWNLAFAHPEMFAALVPIAGFVDRIPMIENCKIKDIPTRIFHGQLDDVVDYDNSVKIFEKLRHCHNDIQLTIFPDANHDSWTRVYDNSAIYDWMLKQNKLNNK